MFCRNRRLGTINLLKALLSISLCLCLFAACQKTTAKVESEPEKLPLQSHLVTFNSNGGSIVSSQMVIHDGLLDLHSYPIRSGYAFCGWFLDNETFIEPFDFEVPVINNVSLYAKWRSVIPELVRVPGGSFIMGSDDARDLDAKPEHTVAVSGFYMAKYHITQGQYYAVTGYNPSEYIHGAMTPERPVETLSWYDAVEFCNKLSSLEGLTLVYTISSRFPASGYPIASATVTPNWSASGYRLPTEAEWEYAAKGGEGMGPYFAYSGSDVPGTVAWFNESSRILMSTYPVGTKEPNGLGIYDMSGNAWEWCWDWFGKYPDSNETNPHGPSEGSGRVIRGGSWSLSKDVIRTAYRNFYIPSISYNFIGVRPVRN